ncbi:lyase family protein, partial [Staphylococcus saprophyticus]|uniref:lyase family protein n=1 Tax=Staphylococcus saprophyticus TaxID=29385 RepID=UPI0037037FAC
MHYNLTSTNLLNTTLSYLIKQPNQIIQKHFQPFIHLLPQKPKHYKYTLIIPPTHRVHPEPTTFRVKIALSYTQIKRNLERF